MRVNKALIAWSRRVVIVDPADGEPVVIQAHRVGRRISWKPIIANAVRSDVPIAGGLRPGVGMTTWLETPLQSPYKARQILHSVLDTKLPFPLEDCLYTCGETISVPGNPEIPVSGQGIAALAVFARKSDLHEHETIFAAHEVRPHLLDHEGIALWSSLPMPTADVLQVVVWCRPHSLLLVIGYRNTYWSSCSIEERDTVRMMRWIQLQKQTTLGGRYKKASIKWWCGGAEADVDSVLSCMEGVSVDAMHVLPDGALYLAREMAKRALLPGTWRIPALKPAEKKEEFHGFLARRSLKSGLFCISAAVCLLLLLLGRDFYLRQRLQAEDVFLQQTVNELAGYPVVARGWHGVQVARDAIEERRSFLRAFEEDSDAARLAGIFVSVCAENGGYLEALRLDTDTMRAMLWLPDAFDPDRLRHILIDNGFSAPSVERSQREGDMVQYSIRAERGQP